MNQQTPQSGTTNDSLGRPAIMDRLSTTQLSELEDQFDEHDRSSFTTHADSYGWSTEEADAVWQWLLKGQQSQERGQ